MVRRFVSIDHRAVLRSVAVMVTSRGRGAPDRGVEDNDLEHLAARFCQAKRRPARQPGFSRSPSSVAGVILHNAHYAHYAVCLRHSGYRGLMAHASEDCSNPQRGRGMVACRVWRRSVHAVRHARSITEPVRKEPTHQDRRMLARHAKRT